MPDAPARRSPDIPNAPDISLIVCTKNRRPALMRCLHSAISAAERQRASRIEIVVVDNGSTDDTTGAVLAMIGASSVPIVLASEGRPGLGAARNKGLAIATGRLLAFTDDDCELRSDYFEDLLRRFDGDGGDVLRGGRVELGDPTDLPFTIKTADTVEIFAPGRFPGGFVHGCNLVAGRRLIEDIGPFDERFGAGAPLKAAEDTDYLLRAHFRGKAVEYVPDMCVYHFHGRRRPEEIVRLIVGYSYGNGAIFVKHGLRAPWLLKYLYWTLRDVAAERIGRASHSPGFGVSNWRAFAALAAGALAYLRCVLLSGWGRRPA
jgi:glycosyltransferase involved in cell wall biosynthesis